MSLRTFATNNPPHHHLKTSISLQMTSAIRHISPAALHNGPILSALLPPLLTRHTLTIQPETATLTALHNNQPNPALSAITRTPLTTLTPHTPIPLAALTTPDPHTHTPLIKTIINTQHPHTWWKHTLNHLLPPPLHLLQHHHIALEAHGQNTLLTTTHHGHPTGTIYRDFGGIRINTHHHNINLKGDLHTTNPHTLNTKLIASLYTNTLTSLVHALATAYHEPPDTWWKPVTQLTHHHTTGDLHTTLLDKPWPIKATTAMRLATNPTNDIWTTTPNPLTQP